MIQKELVKYALKEISEQYNEKLNLVLLGFEKSKGEDMYNITVVVSIAKIGYKGIRIDNLEITIESSSFYKLWIEYKVKKCVEEMLKDYIKVGVSNE